MNAIAAIVRANLRRMVNDRSNIFFIIVLPLLIVFALGSAIGSSTGAVLVGVVDTSPTDSSSAVLEAMRAVDGVEIRTYSSADELRNDVARRVVDVGWAASSPAAGPEVLTWYASQGQGQLLRGTLESIVRAVDVDARVLAIVTDESGRDDDAVADALDNAAAVVGTTPVAITTPDDPADDPTNITAVLAAGELTLFIFLTSLTGASYLLLTRQYGITRRMRAGPVTIGAIILGEGLSRYVVALAQAGIVLAGSTILFGVDWKDLGAVLALSAAMALVGTAAAILLGTVARNEQQAGAIGLMLGLVLAALGGSMQPLHFFPDALRTAAFATPHAWMNDALWRILVDGEGLAEVWPSIVILVGVGVVLSSLASAAMARTLR